MNNSKSSTTLYKIITIGLMSALVFVGNKLTIPIGDITRIHVGNSMCLLAGLLFGGVSGGLSAGIGGFLFDFLDPLYIASAPFTFISKFAMGFTAGALRNSSERIRVIIAAISGQLAYIILYLGKKFIESMLLNGDATVAFTVVKTAAVASLVNGAIAVIVAVPLYFTLKVALKNTAIYSLIDRSPAKVSK